MVAFMAHLFSDWLLRLNLRHRIVVPLSEYVFIGNLIRPRTSGNSPAEIRVDDRRSGAMKVLVATILTVAALSVMNGSAAAITPSQLQRSCQSVLRAAGATDNATIDIPVAGLACWYYMSAVQNMSAVVDQDGQPLLGICAPEGTTLIQYVRIFARYAQHHPEKDSDNAAPLVLHALIDAFPCGTRGPA
jgi:hypothetical protein